MPSAVTTPVTLTNRDIAMAVEKMAVARETLARIERRCTFVEHESDAGRYFRETVLNMERAERYLQTIKTVD